MKNKAAFPLGQVNLRILLAIAIAGAGMVLAFTGFGQNKTPGAVNTFSPSAGMHTSRSTEPLLQDGADILNEIEQAAIAAPTTRTSFMARWQTIPGAEGYRLDVSSDIAFKTLVEGYSNLDVGNVTGRVVTGLNKATNYYYRVRPYSAFGPGLASNVISATTTPTSGLIINATFDSSITANPNAVAIEAMINQAISIYESLFSDPVTIQIYFRYSTTAPNGSPLGSNNLAISNWPYYIEGWSQFTNALIADSKTSNDTTANSSLPGSPLSSNIDCTSGNGRAIGLNTPTAMFSNGTVGIGGPYDGIVTLNSAQPFKFTRPTNANKYDALRTTEHEMDEVMGLGSFLNIGVVVNGCGTGDLRPQDLFSWSSHNNRNFCAGPNGGTRYFSINSGSTNIVNFSQDLTGDGGDWSSAPCPQANPYVQNAFSCENQYADVTATSPEGINLDVIGYDLVTTTCSYMLSPTNVELSASAGGSSFGVTTGSSCNWTATPNASWITITSNGTGPGSKQVSFSVTANTSSSSRNGTISVAGQIFSVTQDGMASGQPNLTPYQPSRWSDKIVVTTTSGATKDTATLKKTKPLYVDWAAINKGTSNITTTFYTYLYIDGVLKNSWFTSVLNVNSYAYVIGYPIGTLAHGNHSIMITTDATHVIPESNENDNSYTKQIFVN